MNLSDPYVVLKIGEETIQTNRHDNTLNPYFDETHIMTWNGKDNLVCSVFDHDVHNKDEGLGEITIPLNDFDWMSGNVFKLHDLPLNNTNQGTITLEICELGSLAGVERGLKLHREMMLCPKCGGTGQVTKLEGLPNGHRYVLNEGFIPALNCFICLLVCLLMCVYYIDIYEWC